MSLKREVAMSRLILATTATDNPMGAQRYEREVAAGAPKALPDWEIRQVVARSLRSHLAGQRRLPISWLETASPAMRRLAGALVYPGRSTVLHRMDLVLPPGPAANVVTIHDTVSWRFSDESPPIAAAASEARQADAVVCVSQFSADEVQSLLGVREPIVIYNGVDERFFAAVSMPSEQRMALHLEGPYVLHAGGAARRKNLEVLAAAWPAVHRARPDLILALSGPPHARRTELFKGMAGVRMLGRQPEDLLPALVASAEVVVVPSTYEGFGLPALEGMAAGVPVVAARTSALPEVVGNAGILVEPSERGIRDGILDALELGHDRPRLVAAGRTRAGEFTWQRCAAEHAAVWRSVV